VFLLEPSRTQFDLNFRLGDIPVRVHPFFWVVTLVLGWDTLSRGWQFLAIWIVCVFVSILVHELGHILMGRLFGSPGHIVLYSFGGLAVGSNAQPSRWKRILVSFAGPLAGFVLYGLVEGVKYLLIGHPDFLRAHMGAVPYISAAIGDLIWINLYWGLVNLLPIWPLDGGQISRDIFTGVMPQRGARFSLGVSMLVAGLIAVNELFMHFRGAPLIPHVPALGDLYLALFFGLLAISNFMQLQQTPQGTARQRRPWERDEEERAPWERDPDYWKKGSDPWNE
jgi:stage IV sporulation protein FB